MTIRQGNLNIPSQYLKAFEGRCYRCKKQERAYYFFADTTHRNLMSNGRFMSERANCPGCVTNPILSTPRTMEWQRELKKEEVMKDLIILTQGVSIDFDAAENMAKQQQKNDIDAEHYELRSRELLAWIRKKEGF